MSPDLQLFSQSQGITVILLIPELLFYRFRFMFIELIARRLTIKKLSKL